jgi:hypothetical protein
MNKAEFLQGLKEELEGRVPYSVIQENLRYYDSYISGEAAKGVSEEEVVQELGGPKIIARTIVDAAFDTEDRPDGYETYGSGPAQEAGNSTVGENPFEEQIHRRVHYVDFNKWYVKLLAGLAIFGVVFMLLSLFFGILGLAGAIILNLWPVFLVLMILWIFKGTRR